jgi:hypothetical protein
MVIPKIIAAGIVAFFVLSSFCLAYYNIPVHITSKTGTTDYVWEKHAYYSKMTEGFGHGRMNNEGFNNLEDYLAQPIDILLMGSSQMEATNVAQGKTTAALLNSTFGESKYVYNIGISGHDLPHSINNLETAIHYYAPKDYVVIETMSVQFGVAALEDLLSERIRRIPSYDRGIVFRLQKIPYLRLLYKQYKDINGSNEDDIQEQVPEALDRERYSALLDGAIKRISQIGIDNKVTPIVFYHPHLALGKDGSAAPDTDAEYLGLFKAACGNNGIRFVDMTDAFVEEYKRSHVLPHGFYNTAVGAGHLNKNGHRVIAEELFRQMCEAAPGSAI